jgi:hypothetical protein
MAMEEPDEILRSINREVTWLVSVTLYVAGLLSVAATVGVLIATGVITP